MQPALPTGTQGEEGYQEHGIGVPPPLVGRPGASGELGSTHNLSDRHSTTMVRVPGSSGDSGFHRESPSQEVKIKIEPGMEAFEERDRLRRVMLKDPRIIRVLGGALMTRKLKRKIDQSIWKINLDPLLGSLWGPPRIVLQNTIRWVKTLQRKLSKNYTRPLKQCQRRRLRKRIE